MLTAILAVFIDWGHMIMTEKSTRASSVTPTTLALGVFAGISLGFLAFRWKDRTKGEARGEDENAIACAGA